MQDTKTLMLRAAMDVVSKEGIRSFSMGKAAEKAGLSRQSIYNAFGSKEELLRAAMKYSGERKRGAALKAVSQAHIIEDQLDALFEHLAVSAFRFVKSNPSSDDIIVSAHAVGSEVLQASFEAERQMFEDILTPFSAQLKKKGFTPKQVSDLIEKSARVSKREATSLKHLRELLGVLKAMVLSLLREA